MSESQVTRDPVAEFLGVLGAELPCSPSELSARRHVKSAAATARRRHVRRRRLAIRSGAVAAVVAMVVSTSGVALAGGLPRRVQTMVADAAQMLPMPLPIPYPAAQPNIEMLETEATLPAIDEVRQAETATAEPSESGPIVSEAPARDNGSQTETADDRTGTTGDTDVRDPRQEGDDTRRDGEGGNASEERLWDSNHEKDRGWDDGREHDRWDGGSNDRGRQENDRDRSRDMNRDR